MHELVHIPSEFAKMRASMWMDEGRHLYLSLRKFRAQPLWLAEPYHMVPQKLPNTALRHSSWLTQLAPTQHGIWDNIASFFTQYRCQYAVYCLMVANICTYISLYIRNMAILVNKKLVCISLHQLLNTCDLHLALYMAIPLGFKQEISPIEDLTSTTTTTFKHQRFTLNIVLSCENAHKLR